MQKKYNSCPLQFKELEIERGVGEDDTVSPTVGKRIAYRNSETTKYDEIISQVYDKEPDS